MAKKAKDAFRTISEVATWLDVPAHVLRFWESKFSQIKPVKRAGGRRYYRPSDMQLIGGIKTLLHDQGMTIRGVQMKLREDGIAAVSALSQSVDETDDPPVPEIADAPFVDAPEDTQVGGDNVVPLSRREQRRAELEDQAAKLDPVPQTPPPVDPPSDPPLQNVEAARPEEEDSAPAEDAAPPARTAPIPAPDLSKVQLSDLRRDALSVITALRRWSHEAGDYKEQLQYADHRLRALRDKMAAW